VTEAENLDADDVDDDDADDEFEDEDDVDDEFDDDDDVDEDEDEDDDFNRVVGATSRQVLEYLAKAIVDEPDAVEVDVSERRGGVMLSLHVAPDDMGKVIGRRGRVAQAIRTVVRAAGASEGIEASVDIVD
jgi:predicted RNA-binding protein YlqC (UPF0109 family)